MRIVTQLMKGISGIEWFPLIALCLFVLVFIVILVHTFSIKKERDEAYGRIPLDEEETDDDLDA